MECLQQVAGESSRGTDAEVVASVLGGDREAFRVLVERYHRPALAFARHTLGDRELAQDAAQEAFIEAFRSLGNLKEPPKFRYWLFGILRHRCLKVRASTGPATIPFDSLFDLAGEGPRPDADAARGSILDLLGRLSRDDQQLLSARYVHELSYAEIGAALRITCGAVRVRCLRARDRLRRMILVERAGDPDPSRFDRATLAGSGR